MFTFGLLDPQDVAIIKACKDEVTIPVVDFIIDDTGDGVVNIKAIDLVFQITVQKIITTIGGQILVRPKNDVAHDIDMGGWPF